MLRNLLPSGYSPNFQLVPVPPVAAPTWECSSKRSTFDSSPEVMDGVWYPASLLKDETSQGRRYMGTMKVRYCGDWTRLVWFRCPAIWEMIMRLTLTKSINDHSYKVDDFLIVNPLRAHYTHLRSFQTRICSSNHPHSWHFSPAP